MEEKKVRFKLVNHPILLIQLWLELIVKILLCWLAVKDNGKSIDWADVYLDVRRGRRSRRQRRNQMRCRQLDYATLIRTSRRSSYVNSESMKSHRPTSATSRKKLSVRWRVQSKSRSNFRLRPLRRSVWRKSGSNTRRWSACRRTRRLPRPRPWSRWYSRRSRSRWKCAARRRSSSASNSAST
jgi:hypothetical protein